MLSNYIKTAIRSLRRHKSFSLINIAGLTLGLTATLLIAVFVRDEFQFDKFIPGGANIYRVYNEYTQATGDQTNAVTPPAYATVLQADFPAVEATTRVLMQGEYKALVEAGSRKFYEAQGRFADSAFFRVFSLPLMPGSAAAPLNDPASVVLSREMASRYFGNEDPIGRKLLIDKTPVQVTGLFDKNPAFHLQFDYLRPLSALQISPTRMAGWQWQQFFTYIKVRPGTNIPLMQAGFQRLVHDRADPVTKKQGYTYSPFFQPLYDIHLYSAEFKFDQAERGNITYVRALLIIAVFILLIACFNFINLSTALSVRRAREVGVRKTVGAGRRQLIVQFIGETLLLSVFSILLALVLTEMLLPALNHFTGKSIPPSLLLQPPAAGILLLLAVTVGLLAGFYPALVLSAFDPVKVLKTGAFQNNSPGRVRWLRHGLVIVQFSLSVLLILSATIVYRQVSYLHNKDLGFNKAQILFFPMRGNDMARNADAFKSDLLRLPGVSSVSIGYGFPGDAVAGDNVILNRNGRQVTQSVTQLAVDFDYIKTLELKIVAGRDFSRAMGTDKDHAWIINETAVRDLGFGTAEKALGQTLSWHPWDGNNPDSLKTGKIIGVVKDFNYKSLYDKVEPAVLQIYPQAAWKVAVKVKTAGISGTIAQVSAIWNKYAPDYPIEYQFLDDNFGQMYRSEDKLQTLLWVFTGIAIFIGCLGLFGLAAYTAETRRKEVGIRKILGARTEGVVILLSTDFIRPVIISLLIASPVTWYVMNRWLEGFAYRVAISWWIFVLAGTAAVAIALLTVSYTTIRAALANPAKSLRIE